MHLLSALVLRGVEARHLSQRNRVDLSEVSDLLMDIEGADLEIRLIVAVILQQTELIRLGDLRVPDHVLFNSRV